APTNSGFYDRKFSFLGLLVGWGRVYADCLSVTYISANPPLQILGFTIANLVYWGYWWGGGGFMPIVCR
ncbi:MULTISPECIES: hypothetical protein, partial [unclassified Microcoleus]|uniref:hypothetical protein n=1 Tax=unclassified Microcoleus TaxID=2642155 RepID=UPI002FD6C897